MQAETFNELGYNEEEDLSSTFQIESTDPLMDDKSLKDSQAKTTDTLQDEDMPAEYVMKELAPVKILLSTKEFERYEAAGYFDGVQYSWKFRDGSYEVIIQPQSYMRFYNKKSQTVGKYSSIRRDI